MANPTSQVATKVQRARVAMKLVWIAYKPKVLERLQRAPWERKH